MSSLFRIARRSILLWFGAAFLAGGLFFLFMGIQWGAQDERFQNEGRSVEAVVLSKSIKPASREENSSTRYEIAYRFTTEDGREMEGTDAVGVEQWERLDVGDPIEITYLRGDLQSNRAQTTGDAGSSFAAIVLGSIFAVVGGVFFVRSAIRVWRQWSILQQGQTAQAMVLAIEPSNAEINNVRQWEVRYQYRDNFGRVHEGTSGEVAPELAHAVAVGDTLDIRFDRERPEESVWIEPELPATEQPASGGFRPKPNSSYWRRLINLATMLAMAFAVIVAGEIVLPALGIDRFISLHEAVLLGVTVGATVVGFALFMGGILYRIFGGNTEAMSHADVEDLSRSMLDSQRRPYFARASKYRFRGKSAGASFQDEFSISEAKAAWKQRAWRDSLRWRGNFVIMAGALIFGLGLFSIFVVVGPDGIRLLCGGAVIYSAVRTIIAFARA